MHELPCIFVYLPYTSCTFYILQSSQAQAIILRIFRADYTGLEVKFLQAQL